MNYSDSFSKLTYSEIESISTNLKTYSGDMEDLLGEIKSLFEKIGTDDVWSGTAASTSKEEFDKLSAKFPEFNAAITDCATYLDKVVANYKAVDSVISGQM